MQLVGSQAHLVLEDGVTLVDAGLPGSAGRIGRYLSSVGRSLDELTRIICTHGHPDHVGGVRELAGDGVQVLMHAADATGIAVGLRAALASRSRGRMLAYVTRRPAAVTPLEDGAVIPVLGGMRVIHVPGHTPGSICLFAARGGLLFVGDALEMQGGRPSFASRIFSEDHAQARRSVQRLAELDVQTIIFSHYPPWRDEPRAVLRELAARAAA